MLLIIIACCLSAILLAATGCITIWYRYTTYSDNIIHILLVAAIISSVFGYSLLLCSWFVSIIFVILAKYLQQYFSDQALVLNVATTCLIAVGFIALNQLNLSVNLEGIFFGDILLVNKFEIFLLFLLCLLTLCLIYRYFNIIVISALNEEIAVSYGVNMARLKMLILLVAATSITTVVQIIGGMMITTLCVVPVFFAKAVSKTPKQMLINSIVFALIFSIIGIVFALGADIPVAATITIVQVIGLFLTLFAKRYIL
jgi:zinc transport system permease protein